MYCDAVGFAVLSETVVLPETAVLSKTVVLPAFGPGQIEDVVPLLHM